MAFSTSCSRTVLIGLAALALPAMAQAAPATAGKGETLFKQRCGACHSVAVDTAPRPAPSLKGIVGRKAASVEGFKGYSPALKGWGKSWDQATLDQFLAAPSKVVPGTFMVINLPKPEERKEVIAYLATVK